MVAKLEQIGIDQDQKNNYSASDIDAEENINIAFGDNVEFESFKGSNKFNKSEKVVTERREKSYFA